MRIAPIHRRLLASALVAVGPALFAGAACAQSFRVQCPTSTALHPGVNDPGIKCQHIGGSDGFATMGDGHQIYLFGFAPLSGLGDPNALPGDPTRDGILTGKPGTQTPDVFLNTNDPRHGRTEPADMMNNGVLYSNAPAPMISIDEDDELFLTLSNVGMIMRPDLFEQHTVHFHGYPNASSYFDGVPDASIAINIAGSFTYYYTAPDAGTYFWHCHIAPPEHLQMGMVGQLFVRPRQNRASAGDDLRMNLLAANNANRARISATAQTTGTPACSDILCTGETPLPDTGKTHVAGNTYAYNDGDGSTRYDVEVPLQMMGFDPNFHFVGMTFNPEAFADMKDKYFLLNGRSYPDTANASFDNSGRFSMDGTTQVPNGPMATMGADGASRPSQPVPSLITINRTAGQTRALLRISDLSVTEHSTLATVGVKMTVIAQNARLLRDMAGANLYYDTNSVTLGGGESVDVIIDVSDPSIQPGTYYLYTTNLDHLSNDAENFGGQMTEIVVL